ncbi:hypothetical protein HMPREF1982_02829 [Clostridiales bacterium oral taxon 876 str. F0540]|nr:hypothetical protein HMPREF1982_02829 [Clostridiales bacterium oral taxon 876 str. F0540]
MDNKIFRAYIGTYTKGESKGIYTFSFNSNTGKIEDISLAAEASNPTYINISKSSKYLYSVIKVNDKGGTAAYSIDNNTGKLNFLNYELEPGSSPCYVSLDSKDNYVFSANYHMGNAEVFPINEEGSIKSYSCKVQHEGSGPNKDRQEKAHAHFAQLTPDDKYLCVVDLGIDKVIIYSFSNGILSKANEIIFKPGSGPRHMAFHPNGKYAYVLTELSSEVLALQYDSSNGSFEQIGYFNALPEDFNGESIGAAIHISPDGNYLYASNRGHNSIAVFKIDASSGKLSLAEHVSTEGDHPRDFEIDPSGNFLLAANMNTNNIVVFRIDKNTGRLTNTEYSISIPSPVCVKFVL